MYLSKLTYPTIHALSRDIPVLIPIAAVEQHGLHLPVMTDSQLLQEIVHRAEVQLPSRVLVAPLLWLGNSHHHLDYAGTLSAEPRVYLDTLVGLLNNMLHHGFRRLLLINGHGGNDLPGKQAVYEVRQQHRLREDLLLLFATYWGLGCRPWETYPDLVQQEMGHACEWETSMMLAIDATAVGEYGKLATVEFGRPFTPASRGWVTQERTPTGHIGSPQQASVEKGEHLLNSFAADLVQMLERIERWNGNSWEG
jgi:creatinine amidohydrolase